jgi:hypothetical protein
MKYKILAGTGTFNKLSAIQKRIEEADRITKALVAEFGAEEWLGNGYGYVAGDLIGIRFAQKPEGWTKIRSNHSSFFCPKSSVKGNKDLLDRIAAIPKVMTWELNDCIGFKPQRVGLTQYTSIGVKWGNEFHLVHVPEAADYTPLNDVIEILGSEYKRLELQLEEERKEVADEAL